MSPSSPRVLGMVLKGYPRISETFISNEILMLERLGFSIRIFSMRKPRENFSHDSVKQIQAAVDYLPETLFLHLPRFLHHNFGLFTQQPRVYLRAFKLALRRFRRTRKAATLKHLLQAGYLVRHLLPGSGVVHFHAHFAHSPASVAMFAALLSGCDFSFTAHAKDIYTSDPAQLREKLSLARFVVTCTEHNRSYLDQVADGRGAPIHRVYHGIDIDLFSTRSSGPPPQGPCRILSVARLTAKKGLPTVYRAVQWLRDQGHAVEHTLIGDGEDREKIADLIRRLELDPITRRLGTQPHHMVVENFRRTDVFVLGCEVAANGDRDGIPNVLMESMAMGVPVVATRVSAIPELIEDGRTGLLVPPGDPVKLAQAVLRLMTDEDLRNRLIDAGRRHVVEHFDNRRLIEALAAIYCKEVPELGVAGCGMRAAGCGSRVAG